MSAQTSYNFTSPAGSAGGLVDLAPYAIDTRLNTEATGTMTLGVGVVQGDTPGSNIALPTADATAAAFEGITTNNRTTEYDLEGSVYVRNGAAMGVLRYGRIYAKVASDVEPAYGDALYLVTSGDEAGYFTNDSTAGVAVKGRFIGSVDATNQVAPVELFNQAQE